jgi:hypothetical protein
MVTSKSKATPAREPASKPNRKEVNSSAPAKVTNPYAISSNAAAQAVRRSGIVTVGGKLSRIYK